MSENFKQILENVKHLNSQERALMAHVIISSLDIAIDEEVDSAWGELAEKRFNALQNGKVKSITWEEIKKAIKG